MHKRSSFVRRSALAAAAFLALAAGGPSAFAAGPVPGAIFTAKTVTTPCDTVNSNIYDSKDAVFLNGGPIGVNGPALPANSPWYVRVTDPSGMTTLGTSLLNAAPLSITPVTTTAAGVFSACYRLVDIVSYAAGMTGYLDTPNLGGEYKVWVSLDSDFNNSRTKTDNFKVRTDTFPPDGSGRITIRKFYDVNADGVYDPGLDIELTGWKVDLLGKDVQPTVALYDNLFDGSYVAQEYTPIQTNWYATGVQVNGVPADGSTANLLTLNATTVTIARPADIDKTVAFGNVCTGNGGGKTLGYWSNRNGEADMNSVGMGNALAALRVLNLKTSTGTDFDPTRYADFRNWLLNGNAVNMAYMLSVQLAAMSLNVYTGKVSGNALIYAPGTNSANTAGFASVASVINEANTSLGLNPTTYAGLPLRQYQEYLKNALDNANNNRTFVQATPCAFSFP
jgi:hypothetical protein